jgi:CHAD domain-containing protein
MKHRRGEWIADAPAESAREELCRFAEEYFEAGRKLLAKRPSASRLHEFRLLTKHLRYTLEVFRPLYGPAMDGYLTRLRKVQTVLGELNDYAVTSELLRTGPDRRHADVQILQTYLAGQEEQRRKEFAQLWTEKFDAPGESARWLAYLRRYARPPKSVV